jgi:hypothetical protein
MADPRASAGNTWKIVIIASGWINPAAAPCSTLARIARSTLGLAPPRSEANMNSANENRKVLRCPRVLTSHAVASMVALVAARNPVDIHCTVSCPT